jgi:hypothetical protein
LKEDAEIITTGAINMTRDERTAHWRGLVDEQAQSGMSAAAFCRDHHLKLAQFYRWRRRLRYEQDNDIASGFLQLIPSSKQGSSGIRIHLGNGLSIELERVFDPHTLRTAIEALYGR